MTDVSNPVRARRPPDPGPALRGAPLPAAATPTRAVSTDSSGRAAASSGVANLFAEHAPFVEQVVRDIDAATREVRARVFSWRDDPAGDAIHDALTRALDRGVRVLVEVDAIGSLQLPGSASTRMIDRLGEAGARIKRHWPFTMRGLLPGLEHDHVKAFEIDGEVAWTGGRNLSPKFREWHDYMLRLEGPLAATLGAGLVAMPAGRRATGAALDAATGARRLAADPLAARRTEDVRVLRTVPGQATEIADAFREAVSTAKDRVWVTTPYIGSIEGVRLLADAARRGVDVRVLVPGPNHWKNGQYALHFSRSSYEDLLDAGAAVREFPRMTHAKAWLVDDTAFVGSANLGARSFERDHEVMVAADRGPVKGEVVRQLRSDWREAEDVDPAIAEQLRYRALRAFRHLTGFEQ